MPITSLPTPPSRGDAPDIFIARADQLLAALPTFVTEANEQAAVVDTKTAQAVSAAGAAADDASSAAASASDALASKNEAASSEASAAESAALAQTSGSAVALANSLSLVDYDALRTFSSDVKRVYVTGYLVSASPSGIAGAFVRDDSDTTSTDNGGTIIVASNGKRWKRVFDGAVNAKWFGAKGDGTTDDTAAIQGALDALESLGGGICYVEAGTYCVSNASANNAYACLVVPANAVFQGAGMGATTIKRLPSERGTDGVLIVNKGWDTEAGFGASGNIVFQDFTITDGAASPQRPNGDLIGIGHADNVIVQRVDFGNHDQHAVDICGSKRVKVINCVGYCEHGNTYRASATVQIDGASGAGAILGNYVDATMSRDVEIAHNHFTNKTTSILIHVGHKQALFENVHIHHNFLDGGYASGDNVIACDNNVSLKNITIADNIVVVNHGNARAINMFVQGNSSETIDGLRIVKNDIRGSGRVGIFAGTNLAYSGGSYPSYYGLIVAENAVALDCSATTDPLVTCINVAGFQSAAVRGNICSVTQTSDATTATKIIFIDRNKSAIVSGNTVRKTISAPGFVTASAGINVESNLPNVGKATIQVSANMIVAEGFKYFLNAPSSATPFVANTDEILFSANSVAGTPNYPTAGNVGAHIYESFAMSDGTNFRRQIDFGASTYIKAIASGQFYSGLSLGMRKRSLTDSIHSPARIDLAFAPNFSTDFDTDVEELQRVYMSATTCAGTQVVDVDQVAGTFAILTGVSGVSMVINNTTFQPVIRTSGYLKAFASI